MAKIVISEFMPSGPIERLVAVHQVIYDPEIYLRPGALASELRDAQALIVRNQTQVRGELLDSATNLGFVGRLGVGLDNIDVETCSRRGIEVSTAAGANAVAVAEYVLSAALYLRRWECWHYGGQLQSGQWQRKLAVGNELAGCSVGMLGFGSIAQVTADRLLAFGVELQAYDPGLTADHPAWARARRVDLEQLISQSDILSLHVPLLPSTQNILSAERIKKLKKGAIVINSARGGLVDEIALIDALKAGLLGGVALDVFATEPPPSAAGLFAGTERLLLSPHVAGLTEQSNQRVAEMIADKLLTYFSRVQPSA